MKEYKVLTLWEPWATLLVHGVKKIETRPKPTTWTIEKGSYLIHASQKWTKEQFNICHTPPFINELLKIERSFVEDKEHPNGCFFPDRGHVIGAIDIVECCEMKTDNNGDVFINLGSDSGYYKKTDPYYINEPELSFGHYREGRYAWITDNPRILETPIPWKGQQGYYQKYDGDVSQLNFRKKETSKQEEEIITENRYRKWK